MTVSIKHAKTMTTPDWTQSDLDKVIAGGAAPTPPSGTLISGVALTSDWNANLTTSMASGFILGRSTAGTGSFEEITVGSGLSLSGGTLSASGGGGAFSGLTGGTNTTAAMVVGTGASLAASGSGTIAATSVANLTLTGANTAASWTIGSGAILTAPSAAKLQLGAADAASPVAQTLSVQNVVAGTSNTAGAPLTIDGSISSGSANGGSIIFRTAAAGTSGTAQNALTTALTIDSTKKVTFGGNLAISGSTATLSSGFTATLKVTLGNGVAGWYSGSTNGMQVGTGGDANFQISNTIDATPKNFTLYIPSSNILKLGGKDIAAPVAQTLSAQSVVAGTTNTAGVPLTIDGSISSGSANGGSIIFRTAAAGTSGTAQNTLAPALTLDSEKVATFSGNIQAAAIGSTAAIPAQVHMPTNTQSGTTYTTVLADAGKYIRCTNAAAVTITIPANATIAYLTDTEITVMQAGAGKVSPVGAGGVTLNFPAGTTGSAGQYRAFTLKKVATDTWDVFGSLA